MTSPSHRITRRGFLAASVGAAVAAGCNDSSSGDAATEPLPTAAGPSPAPTSPPVAEPTSTPESVARPELDSIGLTADPFTFGVASGDPLDDSVILWTRLDPSSRLPEGDIEVRWEVGKDAEMTQIVAAGTGTAIAALGHSVHVDATGLASDANFHYRFAVDSFESTTGQTRTFAPAGVMPDRFRFAFSSCQNWEQGYYIAYRDLVEQGDIDAFVFLGDYIYENAGVGLLDPRGRVTGQDFECETVDQYRQRYTLYRGDPLLQAAHAAVPWIITWDDHEVDNNYAGHLSERDVEPAEFLERRAAAYQVWYEFMPVRLDPPTGSDLAIHRSIAHGDLVRFHVLDTRQFRSDQQRAEPFTAIIGDDLQVRDDDVQFAAEHTMLGAEQFDWLVAGVESSSAVWDVLAQQVFMFGGNAIAGSDPPVVVVDTWDGYSGERQRLLEAIGTGVAADNLIVLTGDFHTAAVGELRSDPFDTDLPVVGVEFMATSISSDFFDANATVAELVEVALANNPQLRFFDTRRGYTMCDVTPEKWVATYRAVNDQFDQASAVQPISTWTVTAGTAAVEQTA